MNDTGINSKVIRQIRDMAEQYGVKKVLLFGSRARGDFKRTSDIDIGRGSYCMKKYENFCASLVNMKTYGFGLCRREIKRNNELDNCGLNVAFSMNNGIINDSNETVFSEILKI